MVCYDPSWLEEAIRYSRQGLDIAVSNVTNHSIIQALHNLHVVAAEAYGRDKDRRDEG